MHYHHVRVTVAEIPPAPSPVERDPFLDGLDSAAPSAPARGLPSRRRGLEQRAVVLSSLIARPDHPQSSRPR